MHLYVCVQCILYCVYLSHPLNIVAPSRSCIRSRRRVCLPPLFITCFSVHFPNFNGFGFDYGLACYLYLDLYRYFHLYLLVYL